MQAKDVSGIPHADQAANVKDPRLPGRDAPYRWCRGFRVNTPQGCFRWLTLPFGWKYSPVLCQRLVSALVRRALRDFRARGVTCLEDVLVSVVGTHRLRVAARRVSRVLGRAGFLISPKSVIERVRTLDFIGSSFLLLP